jgi:hypothetical protein
LVFTYVYSRYALCLLLQILLVAALDIKTRDVPTVSPINSSQYCKASHFFFFCKFLCTWGGGGGGRTGTVIGLNCDQEATDIPYSFSLIRPSLRQDPLQNPRNLTSQFAVVYFVHPLLYNEPQICKLCSLIQPQI